MSGLNEIVSKRASVNTVLGVGLSWPMLLGATAFLAVLASGAVRTGPDTYWHIVAGHWILTHGHVPMHDPFSFTMHGTPWVAQEWGAELLMALVYGMAGWPGLILLTAALFGLTIAYIARFTLSRMEPLHALSLTVLSGCMTLSYILVRPEEFVWPLTALWVGMLIESSESGRAPPWWLLGVMLLWANLQASFILGLGLAVVIGVEAVVNAKQQWKSAARRWGAFGAAAFVCALLNPQSGRLLIFPFHVLAMHVLGLLTEWQQPNFQHLQVFGLWLVVMLALAFAGRIRLPLLRMVPFVGLIYFALQHIRNVSLLGIVSPFLIAGPLAILWKRAPARGRDAEALDKIFQALAGQGRGSALVATVVLSGVLGIAMVSVRRPVPATKYTPRAALDALLAKRPDARILNDYNFGGYLIFRGVPVFVDGRADMYGNKFVESYFDGLELLRKGAFSGLVDKYRINAVLMGPQWPVVRLLGQSRNWKRVYQGKWAVAYVRRTVTKS